MSESYAEKNRKSAGIRSRESYAKLAEIGPLPPVANPERKDACRTDLLAFLQTYFPNSTGLKPFSDDHRRMIARLQRCILFGGKMTSAVFRGFAKTTIGENACLWAALYGHRLFIPLLGADNDAAAGNLESIKRELETNDLLYEDFPEVCHCVRALEGRTQRAATQTLDGKLTRLGWTANEIVFPTVEGSDSSGVCIRPQSLLSCSRGMTHKTPDGRQIRPDFVFVDDPQTDESAMSPAQVEKRLSKLKRTVLRLAGHNKAIAIYIAATVIERGDMIDQLLDPKLNPDWQGERVAMVKRWSDAHETFWLGPYANARLGFDRNNPDDKQRAHRDATQLYYASRQMADAGAEVAWEHCFSDGDGELSAIQHAYNMLIDDGPEVFAAECQNQPPDRTKAGSDAIEPEEILARNVGPAWGVVPSWATRITAFIDVQSAMLWYAVAAWADDFTGCVIEYGAYPDQGRAYFTKGDIKHTLAKAKKAAGQEGQIWAGLETLTARLLGGGFVREDQSSAPVELLMIDEGFQTPTIYEFAKRSTYANRIIPAKGAAIGASSKPFEEYQRREGETLGTHWRRTRVPTAAIRHVIHDPNWWKTFVWNRLRVPIGDRGALTLAKAPKDRNHRMLADHVALAEYPVRVEGNGRTVEEWKERPNRDNDLFDCLVGCTVAASVLGCRLDAVGQVTRKSPRKRKATGAWAA